MKKLFIVMMALALVAGLTGVSMAGISGTDHDLSAKGFGSTELCIFCHTPHNADTTVAGAPLWNHDVTTATFIPYSSPTMDANPLPGQPAGASKLCLSCHDGTVAIDSYGGKTGTNFMGGSALLDTDLSDDHPISFAYDVTLVAADGELADPTVVNSGLGGTIDQDMLFAGQMECASCHDVHDDTNGNFLLMDNDGSALCLTCHLK